MIAPSGAGWVNRISRRLCAMFLLGSLPRSGLCVLSSSSGEVRGVLSFGPCEEGSVCLQRVNVCAFPEAANSSRTLVSASGYPHLSLVWYLITSLLKTNAGQFFTVHSCSPPQFTHLKGLLQFTLKCPSSAHRLQTGICLRQWAWVWPYLQHLMHLIGCGI